MKYYVYSDAYGYARQAISATELAETKPTRAIPIRF